MEKSKSRSLKVASNVVWIVGLLACLLGAIVYMILHELDVEIAFIGPFEWEHLYYVAALAGVFIIIALILRIAANVAARKEALAVEAEANESADAEEDDKVEAECCKNETEDSMADEGAVAELECEAIPAVPAKTNYLLSVLKSKSISPETKEKVVATVKKNAPVILAVAATATVSILLAKSAKEKRKAKIRKNILDLLY